MKLNRKGFTLIELLAVITIMGILMLVAIPAISRTIENSRRDTFADIAHEYINAVRNGVLADNISCVVGGTDTVASALPDGDYYFPIATAKQTSGGFKFDDYVTSTTDIMEKGGKSPFGNADVFGYVHFKKETKATSDGSSEKTTTTYKMALVDRGNHGIPDETEETSIKRAAVKPSGAELSTVGAALGSKTYCKVS